ncbi:MAG: transposase [Thermodesulfobacteriota bacterium]
MKERKLNRLKDYDYSQNGYYFVTICTKNREAWFGKIESGKMILNQYGEIVERHWKEMPNYYKNVEIDEFIIMPNHIHGIIIINRNYNDGIVGTEHCSVPTEKNHGLLSNIVKSFKNAVTKRVHDQFQDYGFKWQRSFYDHIIRDEIPLNKIREYITNNPLKWESDIENKINFKESNKDYYKKIIEG